MIRPTVLTGGTIVQPDRTLPDGTLSIVGEQIESVGTPRRPPSMVDTIDVSGSYVLPGLVDIHGDDIEQYLCPRPEERVPAEMALQQSEQAAVAAGVTTKFHAVAFEETPGDQRSIETATTVADTIRDRQEEACIDTRLHARCELADATSVAAVTDRLSAADADLVSLMNHVPGEGQYTSADGLSSRYNISDGSADDAVHDSIQSRSSVGAPTLASRRSDIVHAATAAGVPVASHDDTDSIAVDQASDHGVDICEFPVTMDAAQRATERDMTVAMGAPNLVRGGSLYDNLDAHAAIAAGAVDVLCSDFRPPTLLQAAFVDTGEPLHTRVNRVSAAPASAVGLEDRGRLEPGERADIVVVDPDPQPTVSRVFVAGNEIYRFDPSA